MKTRTLKHNLAIDTISSTVLTAFRVFVQARERVVLTTKNTTEAELLYKSNM